MVCLFGSPTVSIFPSLTTPTRNDRHNIQAPTEAPDAIVSIPGTITDRETSGTTTPTGKDGPDLEKSFPQSTTSQLSPIEDINALPVLDHATAHTEEIVRPPSLRTALPVLLSKHALFHVATYACSFGGELAINSVLAAYYLRNFPYLGQTGASNYAAMFGFLNFVTRPLGGVVGDVLYKVSGGQLWWKKGWVHVCGMVTGVLLIVIGVLDPHDLGTMIGLVVIMAVFHEAGNGANFALIPHVFPHANGLMSGLTGAGGNLGGVVFAVVFRFMDGGTNYAKGFWVIGIVHVVLNLAVCWVPPIPKGQIGGR